MREGEEKSGGERERKIAVEGNARERNIAERTNGEERENQEKERNRARDIIVVCFLGSRMAFAGRQG